MHIMVSKSMYNNLVSVKFIRLKFYNLFALNLLIPLNIDNLSNPN